MCSTILRSAPTLPLLLSLSRACLLARLPLPAPSCRPPSQPLSLLLRKAARSRHLSRKNPRLFGKPAGENRFFNINVLLFTVSMFCYLQKYIIIIYLLTYLLMYLQLPK